MVVVPQSNLSAPATYDLIDDLYPYNCHPPFSSVTFRSEYADWDDDAPASPLTLHNTAARASSPTLPRHTAKPETPLDDLIVKPWLRALNSIHRNLSPGDDEVDSDWERSSRSSAWRKTYSSNQSSHTSMSSEPQTPQTLPCSAPPSFSVDGLPTTAETSIASELPIIDEDGCSFAFRTIFYDFEAGDVKTIVCFIRHFLCPLCQDYMYSIARNVDPIALKRAGLRLVIIGNGSWKMIKSYKRIFKLPYAIYTDPAAALYTTLGMTLRTLDAGPKPSTPSEYVRHRAIASGISLVLRNAIKARMLIGRYMGDKTILGGEFVFSVNNSAIECEWAHRMQYTTAHEGIRNVLGEARGGVPLDAHTDVFAGAACGTSFCSSGPSSSPPQIQSEVIETSHPSRSASALASKNSSLLKKERKRWTGLMESLENADFATEAEEFVQDILEPNVAHREAL